PVRWILRLWSRLQPVRSRSALPGELFTELNIQLFVFDNRTLTEKLALPLSRTINQTRIQETMASIVPFARVTVKVNPANITDYPGLAGIVANATTKLIDPSIQRPIVDGNLLYRWLTTNGLGHVT